MRGKSRFSKLIKQTAEQRTIRLWDFSVRNAAREIQFINKRRKSGGFYASEEELREIIDYAYPTALEKASLEAFEGVHTEKELEAMVDPQNIKDKGWHW